MGDVQNELRRAGRITTAYLNALGMTEGIVDRLGDTLIPTMDVWSQPDWNFLRGDHMYAREAAATAVAARFSQVQLVMPSTATALAVVRKIVRTGGTLRIQLSGGPVTGVVQNLKRGLPTDSRSPRLGGETSQLEVNEVDAAAGLNLPQWFLQNANGEEIPPFVVGPGSNLFISELTANTAMGVVVFWTERTFFPSEL